MKIWAYLAILAIIVGAIGGTYVAGHSSGYDKRDQQVQQEIMDAQEAARLDEEEKWRGTVAAAEGQIVVEEVIVEKIRVVEKEIPKIIKEFILPECRDLGAEYAGLRNDQTRAANSVQDTEITDNLVE